MLRWLLPESKAARVVAALWTLACVSLLIRTLCFLNAPHRVLADAVAGDEILMGVLSFPASLIISLPLSLGPSGGELGYAWTTWHSILIVWLSVFVLGYFQWFCLPRAAKNHLLPVIEKVYDVSPLAAVWVRRKCGIKDSPNISCIPKE